MLEEIIISIQSYGIANRFIKHQRLWKLILLPGILYTVLFIISIYFFSKSANSFIEWLSLETGLKIWLDKTHNGFLGFIFTLAALNLWIIQMMFLFSLFKYVWIILGSPIFGYLSQKTTRLINKSDEKIETSSLKRDVKRAVLVALRNVLRQTVLLIAFALIALIPVIGLVAPLFALFAECYFYGYSMLDFNCERKKMTISESTFFIGNHKGLAIGNGLVFYLFHLLPLAGWVLAPSYAIIAATISMQEKKVILQSE